MEDTMLIGTALAGGALLVLFYWLFSGGKAQPAAAEEKPVPAKAAKKASTSAKQQPKVKNSQRREVVAALKGHGDNVTTVKYSKNGKHIVSCSDDRTVRLFETETFATKDLKYTRINTELDHATSCDVSNDGKYVVAALSSLNKILVYGIQDKKAKLAREIKTGHTAAVLSLMFPSSERYIASLSDDTDLRIFSLQGKLLQVVKTNQMQNRMAACSPDARFIATAGFTSDVKLWEVAFTKGGEFEKVERAMDLKGHKSGITCVCIPTDALAATTSKDGTFKLWNINVRYHLQEDPRLLLTVKPEGLSALENIAVSPNCRTVVVSCGGDFQVFSVAPAAEGSEWEGSYVRTISQAHDSAISAMSWSPDSKYLVTCGDRVPRVWSCAELLTE